MTVGLILRRGRPELGTPEIVLEDLERMDARLRGHSESIGQRMERDLEALLPLPEAPYDACEKQAAFSASKLSKDGTGTRKLRRI